MHYSTMDESKQNLELQTLLQSEAGVTAGVDTYCKERFNCFGHLDVHDR